MGTHEHFNFQLLKFPLVTLMWIALISEKLPVAVYGQLLITFLIREYKKLVNAQQAYYVVFLTADITNVRSEQAVIYITETGMF